MKNLSSNFLKLVGVFIILVFNVDTFAQGEFSTPKSTKAKLIRGEVFIIDKTTVTLPKDFSKFKPITTIFVSEINVPNRSWNNGFPDLPEIYEWFAIEYSATIRINQDGNYKFRLVSDDGAKLYIDKKLVIDNDGTHNFIASTGSIKLVKGDYSFKLPFFQGPRYEAGIQLFVKKDGSKEAIFPGQEIELIGENNENPVPKS